MFDPAPITLAVGFPTLAPRTLKGQVGLALADALHFPTRPQQVSGVLGAVLSSIDSLHVNRDLASRLATEGRTWCLTRAARFFLSDLRWFQTSGSSCGEVCDLPVSLADAPRSDTPTAFPIIEVETPLGLRRVEALNGAAKRALADAASKNAPRVLAAFDALQRGDLETLGQLISESHASQRDDFEISCGPVDTLVDIANSCPGALGSRQVGGGFGGCVLCLTTEEQLDAVLEQITVEYSQVSGANPWVHVVTASDPAGPVITP